MSGSSLAKFLLGVIVAIAGFGTIGFIGIHTGHITFIVGDHNKVDNRDQSERVEPAKPIATEIKREPPVPQPATPSRVEPAIEELAQAPKPVELAHARRTRSLPTYEPDEECSCPLETEPEPQPQTTVYVRAQPQMTVPTWVSNSALARPDYSHSSASSEAYVNGSRSVSMSTTTINGRVTQRRVVINGQVVVDE